MSFVFKKIDVKKNFKMKGDIDVLYIEPASQQAFGLILRDSCYINQKENDVKLSIDKSAKKDNFQLSKENEILIENDTEEILVNDDYNIVEENYSRPIRDNIRKVQDNLEEES